jgi:hypothetical protein
MDDSGLNQAPDRCGLDLTGFAEVIFGRGDLFVNETKK